jgi:hypothetical protein
MLRYYTKVLQLSAEERVELAAQQDQQRQKELAASRQAQREKQQKTRAAEALAMRERLARPGPGRPRKTPQQSVVNISNCTTFNVNAGSCMVIHQQARADARAVV